MEQLNEIVTKIDDFVWGQVMLILLVGTGNIVGVATAMVSGGPGALVWNFSDIANALMAIPNLICMLLLSGEIAKDIKEFQSEIKK